MNRIFLLILLGCLLYLVFVHPFISLPALGKHAWNEAIYLTFLHSLVKDNHPFFFYQAYDVNRPDFNVGYIYFWANCFFTKLINIFITLQEFLSFRLLSLVSTLLTLIVLFFILEEFKISRFVIPITLLFFLFSPLILYYGWKAQLEPLLNFLFLLSQLFLIKFVKKGNKNFYFYISCLMLGVLISSRSNFVVFLPVYFVPFLFLEKGKTLKGFLLTISLVAFGSLITVLPSAILYPQYSPLIFLYKRIFEAGKYAFSPGKEIRNVMLVFINDALWKQIILSAPLSIFSLFVFKRSISSSKLKIYFLLLSLTTWIFFSLVYAHAANHTYQTYYGILWFMLGTSITLNFFYNSYKKYISYLVIFSLIVFNIYFSYHFVTSFYGLYTDKFYDNIDAYGTYESYIVGKILKYIVDETNLSGYLLVQSPTVYNPTYHPSITYQEVYRWNDKTKDYSYYNFFNNPTEFIEEIKKRNIALLTITPDVFARISKEFSEYKDRNFIDVCYTKNFTISLNSNIFYRDPTIKLKVINFLRDLLNRDKIASKVTYNDWLASMDIPFYISKNMEKLPYFNHTSLSLKVPKADVMKNNFTIVIFLYTTTLQSDTDIVTKGNIWKVKFGGNKDIYFEASKTSEGYGWIDGAYYVPYLALPSCIVFRYSTDNVSIYINGVKKSETFFLIKNNSKIIMKPPNLLTSTEPLVLGSEKFGGRIKVLIFSKPLNEDEIFKISSFKEDYKQFLIFEN